MGNGPAADIRLLGPCVTLHKVLDYPVYVGREGKTRPAKLRSWLLTVGEGLVELGSRQRKPRCKDAGSRTTQEAAATTRGQGF
jgi:hypothetical protein